MDMRYKISKIEEAIEFGCEERGHDMPVMAVVTLEDENGKRMKIPQSDKMLCITGKFVRKIRFLWMMKAVKLQQI